MTCRRGLVALIGGALLTLTGATATAAAQVPPGCERVESTVTCTTSGSDVSINLVNQAATSGADSQADNATPEVRAGDEDAVTSPGDSLANTGTDSLLILAVVGSLVIVAGTATQRFATGQQRRAAVDR